MRRGSPSASAEVTKTMIRVALWPDTVSQDNSLTLEFPLCNAILPEKTDKNINSLHRSPAAGLLRRKMFLGEARLRPRDEGLRRAKVELQGIEPWSREDERVRSTCLAAFDCREAQGRQQPEHLLSCVCLDGCVQRATAQFC